MAYATDDEPQPSKGWIAWFAYNPVAANLLMFSLLIVGFFTLSDLRTEGFPEPSPTSVTVSVDFDGGSPENVEEGAAIKVEEALNGIEGVYRISTLVTSDNATVTIIGNDGYPVADLKEDVKARVDAISTFPEQVDSVVITEAQEERHVLYVQVYGDTDQDTLKRVSKKIRKGLLGLSTVNKVTLNGARDFEINIEVNEEKLRAYDLSFAEVAQAVQGASVNLSAGELQTSAGTITLQSRKQSYHGNEFSNVIIRSSLSGGIVRLRDIAIVRDGYTEQKVLSTFQGKPSLNLDVELIGRDSVINASDDVRKFVEDVQLESWIPETIDFAVWSDEADNVRDSLSLLSSNALVGMCLVLVLLALFLHPKIALWVAVGIPVSFAGAIFVMGPSFLDYSLNDLTTFAFIIVLGIVVDDAIIIGESIFTHKKRDGGGVETAVRGLKAVATPATFGVLTTMAAFYPLTTFTGNFSGPFRMIAVVVIICLFFSLVESKLILPAHLARIDVNKTRGKNVVFGTLERVRGVVERGLEVFVHTRYQPFLKTVVAHRYQSLCGFFTILILAIGLVTSGVVRTVFFGEDEGNLLYAQVTMRVGTAAEDTHEAARKIARSVRAASSEIKEKYSLEADPVLYAYTQSSSDEVASIIVEIMPGSKRPFYSQEFLDAWRASTGEIPQAKELSFYVDFEGSENLQIELSSADKASLEEATRHLQQKVGAFNGVYDIRTNLDNNVSALSVDLKPEANFLGLRNVDVINQLRSAVFGFEVQRIQRNEEEIRVKVRYPHTERNSISDLEKMRIRTNTGSAVPLIQVADIRRDAMQPEITRINGERVLVLTAQIDEEVITPTEINNAVESTVMPLIAKAYPGVDMEITGEGAAEKEASSQLSSGFILGLLMIYALLAIPLKSYIEPVIIMLAIPFGVIGAIIGHMIVGIPISLLSFFGILALSGIVVNDALVLVSRYNQIRKSGVPYAEAVVEAGVSRFRAVFLTSITTFVGLAPLLQERSEQAQTLIPMAVSIAFGILFATVITLLIIPVLLGVHSDIKDLMKGRREHTEVSAEHSR